ncbi:MAG: hypothetical protein GXO39_09080 [Thermotogae bacterium]|nr:hypothetical protein [Thermotogota bacterium]
MNGRPVGDLVVDIETVRSPLSEEELSYLYRKEDLLDEEERERYRQKVERQLPLWGFTGHIASVALGVVERKKNGAKLVKCKVLYLSEREELRSEPLRIASEEYNVDFVAYDLTRGTDEMEQRILREVWHIFGKVRGRIVTFNGRRFDLPFLMHRSLILNVPISRYLIKNRFKYREHFDIMDVLAFHGVTRFASLDFVCRRMGIPSPKKDMEGKDVDAYFNARRYEDIALYNCLDVWATVQVYDRILRTFGPMIDDYSF